MIFNVLSVMSLILSFLLGIFVYVNNRKSPVNKTFVLFIFGTMLWIFTNLMTDISVDLKSIKFWSELTLVGPIFIGYFFYRLSLFFPVVKKTNKYLEIIIIVFLLTLLALIPTKLNIVNVYFLADQVPAIVPGPLYTVFLIYFATLFLIAFRNLFKGYVSFGKYERLQVQYISLGLAVSGILGVIADLILPIFNNSDYVNYGPYFTLIFTFFASYAIIRFKMFDVKIIATQLLVFSLWIFVLLRMLIADNLQDQIVNASLLLFLLIFGSLLMKSVIKEVESREKIEALAGDLEKANVRLTELDRQKSEFVSFATHQLRAPLTAMKGYSSLLMEGEMGPLTPEAREGVSRIFDSTNTLVNIVNDYLNISRIELGTMKYAFETIDLKTLVEDVIAEIKPNIDKSGLKFSFTAENNGTDYRITADRDKLKQVIANLIDNSVKYTPRGSMWVTLSTDRAHHKFVFSVKDTGVGISPETMPRLFQKFSRAENANKTNIRGTGLGLYVAKEIIEAHHATIRAESPGEGKGSTFIVELEPFAKA
jgi:signal transduction histidine kinase